MINARHTIIYIKVPGTSKSRLFICILKGVLRDKKRKLEKQKTLSSIPVKEEKE